MTILKMASELTQIFNRDGTIVLYYDYYDLSDNGNGEILESYQQPLKKWIAEQEEDGSLFEGMYEDFYAFSSALNNIVKFPFIKKSWAELSQCTQEEKDIKQFYQKFNFLSPISMHNWDKKISRCSSDSSYTMELESLGSRKAGIDKFLSFLQKNYFRNEHDLDRLSAIMIAGCH